MKDKIENIQQAFTFLAVHQKLIRQKLSEGDKTVGQVVNFYNMVCSEPSDKSAQAFLIFAVNACIEKEGLV